MALAIFALCLPLTGCHAPVLVRQDELVKIYERLPVLPHGYGDEILEINGRQFHHFFGPGYLRVPEMQAVMFLTSPDGEKKILHVMPISGGRDFKIDLGDTTFGTGFGQKKDEPDADYLDKIDGDKVTFVSRILYGPTAGSAMRSTVDLKAGTFVQILTVPEPR